MNKMVCAEGDDDAPGGLLLGFCLVFHLSHEEMGHVEQPTKTKGGASAALWLGSRQSWNRIQWPVGTHHTPTPCKEVNIY